MENKNGSKANTRKTEMAGKPTQGKQNTIFKLQWIFYATPHHLLHCAFWKHSRQASQKEKQEDKQSSIEEHVQVLVTAS